MATSETVGNLQQVIDWVKECKDRSVTSLAEYTKKTMIMSRAYVEESLTREDGMIAIMKFANQLLGGFVFTAIGMNNIIAGGRTVREMASMISTEDFNNFIDLVQEKFGEANVKITAAMEANDPKKGGDASPASGTVTTKDVKIEAALFCGRLIEVQIADGHGNKVPLYFYVQIAPYTTPTSVMEQFISSNFTPDVMSRWAKFRAGEIKFWRDFVLETDLVAKRKKALKADKEGILREIEDRRQSQITKSIASKSLVGQKNHNSASSIIIVSRRTIDRLMKDEGLDYRREDVRQKILDATMSLMLIVYDPNYNTVDLYLNGISNPGNYSVEQLKENTGKSGKDAIDLKTLMTILSTGQTPRF